MRRRLPAGGAFMTTPNIPTPAQAADGQRLDLDIDHVHELAAALLPVYADISAGRAPADEKLNAKLAELTAILQPLAGRRDASGYYAQVFQALRIEVNDEMGALDDMLRQALRVIRPGGRLAVITYHSLEDRMVKNFMRSGNITGKVEQDFYGNRLSPLRPINNKVIIPSEEEQLANPRSRSAKLRIAEKL